MFWIPPAEFRISKTPLSILLVPRIHDPPASRSDPESHGPGLTRRDVYDGGGEPDPALRPRRRSVTQPGARDEREERYPGGTRNPDPIACQRYQAPRAITFERPPIIAVSTEAWVLPVPPRHSRPPIPARGRSGRPG